MRAGSQVERSGEMWALLDGEPERVAGYVPVLIEIVADESPASNEVRQQYHARRRQLAGALFAVDSEAPVSQGDVAALAIGRIRASLVIACAGEGGPSGTLQAVRREIARRLAPQLRDGTDAVRRRVADVLLGDADPALIPHLLGGLHDGTGYVRAMAASAFFVHGRANRAASRAAVPRLLELLEDADAGVRPIAAGALRAIADRDLGEDSAAWRSWWAGQQR